MIRTIPGPGAAPETIAAVAATVLESAPAGLRRAELRRAVAARMAAPARAYEVALGLLIAGGRVDEREGRLVRPDGALRRGEAA